MPGQPFWVQLRSWIIVLTCFFSFFLLFAAPIELYAVYRVRHWQPVQAEVLEAHKAITYYKGPHETNAIVFRDLETNQVVHLSDLRPGDMPFEMSFLNHWTWATDREEVLTYRKGSIITVYRAPNGRDYFMERGSYRFMCGVLAFCLIWWSYVFYRARRHGKAQA